MIKTKEVRSSIVTTIISSEDSKNTYEVKKSIVTDGNDVGKGELKTAIIIMLYPSISAEDYVKCDNTTQAILDHMAELKLSEIRIVNLFSKVCKARMSIRDIAIDENNLEYINQITQENGARDYVWIVAWGCSMSSSVVAIKTKRKILFMLKKNLPEVVTKQISADGVRSKNEVATHPLFLKIRNNNSKWFLEDYVIPKALIEVEEIKEEVKQKKTTQNKTRKVK